MQIMTVFVPISLSFFMFSECRSRATSCDYPPANVFHPFYILWALVPICSAVSTILLASASRGIASSLLTLGWLMLAYIVWAGTHLPIAFPLLAGTFGAASLSLLFVFRTNKV